MKTHEQLDLLTYIPEPVVNPLPPPDRRPSPAELWWEAKADHYLMLMSRFMQGKRCSHQVRQTEILRLHQLRENAKQQAQTIQNREGVEDETQTIN